MVRISMQIIYENINNGELKVQIDSLDDLWVLYNIINPEDHIKGRTFRRVALRDGDPGTRKPMVLFLHVKKVEFHEFSNRLRVLGTILEGPQDWISIGDHHTFNLEPGTRITIFKEKWFRNDIERIRRNLQKTSSAMALCVAIENGLANVALLSNYSLNVVSEIQENIPGKRYAKQEHQKAISKFFSSVGKVIEENLSRHHVVFILLCGPGYFKEHFSQFYQENFSNKDNPVQIRTINASSGELSAIYEILRNGSVAEHMVDFKVAHEEMLMAKFIENLGKDDGTAVYGIEETYAASQMGAIEDLLICDIMIRSKDEEFRQKIEDILSNTEKMRGKVHILSTQNPAGEQLERFGKLAGILRYKVNI